MNKKTKLYLIIPVLLIIAVFVVLRIKPKANSNEIINEISPTIGSIQSTIAVTGTVLPKNRLEVKPPVNGRVESILVKEGENVKVGQILAWMSSTERAALLDAARGESEEKLKYWQEAYKPIALVAPIAGEVIVATTQPGQTVTTADAVVVLSDHLIIRAQVDETDIGKIKLGQDALVSLDAYPDTKIKSVVEHIYYESKTVNNVTIYEVDLTPSEDSPYFRSGMNTTIDFIEHSKENTLIIPLEVVHREKNETFVLIKQNGDKEPVRRDLKLGSADDKNVEVLSGIDQNNIIIMKVAKYALPKSESGGNNPFVPFGKKKASGSGH